MIHRLTCRLIGPLLLLAFAGSPTLAAESEQVLATVNGKTLTAGDIERYRERRPESEGTPQELLQELINIELLVQDAEKSKLDEGDEFKLQPGHGSADAQGLRRADRLGRGQEGVPRQAHPARERGRREAGHRRPRRRRRLRHAGQGALDRPVGPPGRRPRFLRASRWKLAATARPPSRPSLAGT
jgi:hypothetical protein